MPPTSELDEVVCPAEPFAAPCEAQVDHVRQSRGVLEVAPLCGNAKDTGRRFPRMPTEGHRRLASQAEPDRQLRKAPRVQGSCMVGLEEVLPGPRTTTDLYAWAVRIDDKLLAGQPVVSLGTSHLEGARPIHGEPVRQPCGQAGKGLCELCKFLLHCKPNRAVQGDIIRLFPAAAGSN